MADTLAELRVRVIVQVHAGVALDEIDAEVIRPSGLPPAEQAAAWIVARAEIQAMRERYHVRQARLWSTVRERGLQALGTD